MSKTLPLFVGLAEVHGSTAGQVWEDSDEGTKTLEPEVLAAQKKLLYARYKVFALREQDRERAEDERYKRAS